MQAQPFSTNAWQGDTTYNNGENVCAVPSTRQVSLSSWLASGNYSDTEICEETYYKMTADEWVEMAELRSICCVVLLSKRISPSCHTSKLGWSLGDSVCDSLIGLHVLTGCDTMSSFTSRGKLSAIKLMKRDITYQETFSQVHQSWDVKSHLFEKVQQFTCRVYVAASSTTEMNDLRYQLFLRD